MPTPFISCVYCIPVWHCHSNPDLYLPGFGVRGHSSCTCFLFVLGMGLPHPFHHIFFLTVMNLVLPKRWNAINPICRQEPRFRKMKTSFSKAFRSKISKWAGHSTQNCSKVFEGCADTLCTSESRAHATAGLLIWKTLTSTRSCKCVLSWNLCRCSGLG